MPDSTPAVLGFGVIFLIVGGLGGPQLGLTAALLFLGASATLFAVGGAAIAIAGARKRAAGNDDEIPALRIAQSPSFSD